MEGIEVRELPGLFVDFVLQKGSAPRRAADHCAQQSGQIRMYVP